VTQGILKFLKRQSKFTFVAPFYFRKGFQKKAALRQLRFFDIFLIN